MASTRAGCIVRAVSNLRIAIIAVTAVIGILVFALTRDEPSAQLQALEADRMARYVPPGGTLVDTDSQNEGSTFGKPVSARFRRMFELAPGSSGRALEHARTAATAAGWMPMPPSLAFPNVLVADKRLPTGRAHLSVTIFRDSRALPEDVDPPALLVSLRNLGP